MNLPARAANTDGDRDEESQQPPTEQHPSLKKLPDTPPDTSLAGFEGDYDMEELQRCDEELAEEERALANKTHRRVTDQGVDLGSPLHGNATTPPPQTHQPFRQDSEGFIELGALDDDDIDMAVPGAQEQQEEEPEARTVTDLIDSHAREVLESKNKNNIQTVDKLIAQAHKAQTLEDTKILLFGAFKQRADFLASTQHKMAGFTIFPFRNLSVFLTNSLRSITTLLQKKSDLDTMETIIDKLADLSENPKYARGKAELDLLRRILQNLSEKTDADDKREKIISFLQECLTLPPKTT